MERCIQIFVIEPTAGPGYDFMRSDGTECKQLAAYNITFDNKIQQWIGGRADGKGRTIQYRYLTDLMSEVGLSITNEVLPEPEV